MKKKKSIFIAVIASILLIVSAGVFMAYQHKKNQQIIYLTTEQKLEDFDTLCDVLDESYPFWTEVSEVGIDKEALYRAYLSNVEKSNTDIEFFKEISYFLKEFNGYGHLTVLDGNLYRLYHDTLMASNGLLTDQQAEKVQPLIEVLTESISQNTYSLLDQSHSGFRSTIGLKEKYKNNDNTEPEQHPTALVTKILEDEQTAYIAIENFKLTNYRADKAILSEFFEEIRELPNLIIDLRGNSGGSDLYWKELLVEPNIAQGASSERYFLFNLNKSTKEYVAANIPDTEIMDSVQLIGDERLSKYADEFTNYTIDKTIFSSATRPYSGKVWVLVDEKVYSASENFVMFCKNTGFATLVGTPTGGDGGIADPLLVSLPNSGLIVRFSMFYGLNADGTGNEAIGTVPDILLSEEQDALDKVLSLIE